MDDESLPSQEPARAVVERALDAYRALADLAETIDDEWQYVQDLAATYVPALEACATSGQVRPDAAGAVDEAIAEIAGIADPNRAIDWLSTFPHVVALALGVELAGAATSEGASPWDAEADVEPEPPEDSPFRSLLRRDDR